MKTILHVVNLPGPNHWLNGVAAHHDRARFRHLVVSTGPRNGLHESLEERQIPVFALDATSRKQYPRAIWDLARLLRRERVDLVQTHTFDPTAVGLAAAKLARTPVSVLTRHHADFTTLFRKPIHRQIDRLHALTADHVWSPSRFISDCMVRYEHVPPRKITLLPHGFDFELMKPRLTPEARRELRESVGGDDRLLIGMVARLSVEKQHEVLLQAVPAVIRRHPRALFVLIGSGPRQEELEGMARDLGIAESVRFLGWRWDAWNLIEAMDLIAHPSLREPFGIVYVESMALERPVITTSDGAAAEILDHGESGLIVPPRNASALAAAVCELLDDPARARQMGRTARRRAIERFDFATMMRAYEAFYERVLR